MASSRTPLLADDHPHSIDSRDENNNGEETALLGGIATTSPTRPFATSFYPTLFTRSIALILTLPSFIILITQGPHYAPSIVFLSFAIARQLILLASYFGSQIIVIHIEVVHQKLKGVSARAQEKWIKRSVAAGVDGGILIGMLVTLSLVAHEIDIYNAFSTCVHSDTLTAAVILGFIAFGLLLISLPDLGNPNLVTVLVAVEKPVAGVVKLATSLLYGEAEKTEDNDAGVYEHRQYGKMKAGIHGEDNV